MLLMLKTDYGYVSSRFVVMLQEQKDGRWWVTYQAGAETKNAPVAADDVRDYMRAIERSGR